MKFILLDHLFKQFNLIFKTAFCIVFFHPLLSVYSFVHLVLTVHGIYDGKQLLYGITSPFFYVRLILFSLSTHTYADNIFFYSLKENKILLREEQTLFATSRTKSLVDCPRVSLKGLLTGAYCGIGDCVWQIFTRRCVSLS